MATGPLGDAARRLAEALAAARRRAEEAARRAAQIAAARTAQESARQPSSNRSVASNAAVAASYGQSSFEPARRAPVALTAPGAWERLQGSLLRELERMFEARARPSYDVQGATAYLSLFRYAPEGDGTTLAEAIAERAVLGGVADGTDGALNCVQAAAAAQDYFRAQGVETEIVVSGEHAVLRMPDGRYWDPSRAMLGQDGYLTPEEAAQYEGIDGVTVEERDEMAAAARAEANAAGPNATSEERLQAAANAVVRVASRMGADGAAGEVSATRAANDVTVGPLTGEATAHDAARINALAEEDPAAAAQLLEEIVATDPKYKDNPAMVDALLQRVQPALDAMGRMLGDRVHGNRDDGSSAPTRETLEALAFVTSRASPEATAQVGRTLAAYLPDGDLNQFDDRLAELAAGEGPGKALADAVYGALAASKPNAARTFAAVRLDAAIDRFENLQDRVEELDRELAAMIAAAGPGLTQAEYEAIVKKWREDHPEYAQWEAAGRDVVTQLTMHQGALDPATCPDPELAEQVQRAANTLPAISQTEAGFQFLSDQMYAATEGQPSFFDYVTPDANWIKTPQAFFESLGQSFAEAAGFFAFHGDPRKAETFFGFLEARPELFGLDEKEAKALADDLRGIFRAAQRGEFDNAYALLERYNRRVDDAGLHGRLPLVLKGIGALLTVANANYSPETTSEFLRTSLEVVGAGVDLADLGATMMRSSSRMARALPGVSMGIGFLTGVLDAFAAYGHARNGEWAHAASSGLMALSGFAPVAGVIMGFPGVGTLIGGALLGGALAVDAIFGDHGPSRQERLKLLTDAGVPSAIANVLVDAHPHQMQMLQLMGFTTEQIRHLALTVPGLFENPAGYPLNALFELVQRAGLDANAVVQLFDAVGQSGQDPQAVMTLLRGLEEAIYFNDYRIPQSRQEWAAALERYIEKAHLSDDEVEQLRRAVAFLSA